jgi:eukaryotic-like serine/threonine-protein kinase
MILGTAPYMSPEQANGREADRTSDVWACGCVLYEMLTARRAFDGGTMGEIPELDTESKVSNSSLSPIR